MEGERPKDPLRQESHWHILQTSGPSDTDLPHAHLLNNAHFIVQRKEWQLLERMN